MVEVVYTLGYGGLKPEEFMRLLLSLSVEVVVDVRRWTSSRKAPEFSGGSLRQALNSLGIGYVWLPDLGGYRRFGVDVDDVGVGRCFKSEGFRAYATYILHSPKAWEALAELERTCSSRRAVIVCCEKVPARCHRKILSDWLTYRGFKVVHVVPPKTFEHRYTKCARVKGGKLTYI